MRCLWMLEEMGEPYQLIEKSTRTDEHVIFAGPEEISGFISHRC
jgi:hypothetical protein